MSNMGEGKMPFSFKKLEIEDVILVTPQVFGDSRGFFMESYQKSVWRIDFEPLISEKDSKQPYLKEVLKEELF